MPQSFLVFDFERNEEAAQQARHRIEGWKQAFRLGKKIELKFERCGPEEAAPAAKAAEGAEAGKGNAVKAGGQKGKGEKAKASSTKAGAAEPAPANAEEASSNQHIRMIIRLDFSDHEKLSHHRWRERIPTEEPFAGAAPKVVRPGEAEFERTAELFDSLLP